MQAGLYAGFSATEETLALAAEIFATRGIDFPPSRRRTSRSNNSLPAAAR